jgi:hypothetical protein
LLALHDHEPARHVDDSPPTREEVHIACPPLTAR